MAEAAALAKDLSAVGVAGVVIAWADNNGVPRARVVPMAALPDAAERGVGVTSLFAVFDTHDAITFAHSGLSTPSGDVRLIPVLDRLIALSGQPALAWVPGRQVTADGSPWPYDQRGVLEAQVQRAAEVGLDVRAGYEMEFVVSRADGGEELAPAHPGPAYSPHALLVIDEFVGTLLRDLAANGVPLGQLHAEYGQAQVEISLGAADPVTAADRQLLARQTVHAAARAHGLRTSFAPLVTATGVGNGWHLHTSVWRDGVNLLAGDQRGPGAGGTGYLAGLLRDLPALAAVTAPSVPSLARLRPGYFAGAYQFWGVENREAPLRYVPGSDLLGVGHANVELKVCDASANPYLALAVVIAAGVAGLQDGAELPPSVLSDPGTWSEQERTERGLALLPTTPQEQESALLASERIRGVLGDDLLGAFLAVRRSDAAWAADRTTEDVVAAHRWRY